MLKLGRDFGDVKIKQSHCAVPAGRQEEPLWATRQSPNHPTSAKAVFHGNNHTIYFAKWQKSLIKSLLKKVKVFTKSADIYYRLG